MRRITAVQMKVMAEAVTISWPRPGLPDQEAGVLGAVNFQELVAEGDEAVQSRPEAGDTVYEEVGFQGVRAPPEGTVRRVAW